MRRKYIKETDKYILVADNDHESDILDLYNVFKKYNNSEDNYEDSDKKYIDYLEEIYDSKKSTLNLAIALSVMLEHTKAATVSVPKYIDDVTIEQYNRNIISVEFDQDITNYTAFRRFYRNIFTIILTKEELLFSDEYIPYSTLSDVYKFIGVAMYNYLPNNSPIKIYEEDYKHIISFTKDFNISFILNTATGTYDIIFENECRVSDVVNQSGNIPYSIVVNAIRYPKKEITRYVWILWTRIIDMAMLLR